MATSAANPLRMTYREACKQAIRDALIADARTFVMGEDVGKYGGCYAVTKGLLEEFGPERIIDTPLAENGFTGIAVGAAMAGLRPLLEIMTCNFSLLALDQIMNNAATLSHMSGGQFAVPLVIRMATGGGRQLAAQHSHSLEGWYAHIPGLKVLVPGTVEDARFMLAAALTVFTGAFSVPPAPAKDHTRIQARMKPRHRPAAAAHSDPAGRSSPRR